MKNEGGKTYLFDPVRRRYVVLTPEEWVRQHFVNLLVTRYGYPRALLRLEGGHTYAGQARRSDILTYDRQGQPWLLVECKAASVPVTQAVFEQAARYNHVVRARYLVVTNGRQHYCCATDHAIGTTTFQPEIPYFDAVR